MAHVSTKTAGSAGGYSVRSLLSRAENGMKIERLERDYVVASPVLRRLIIEPVCLIEQTAALGVSSIRVTRKVFYSCFSFFQLQMR